MANTVREVVLNAQINLKALPRNYSFTQAQSKLLEILIADVGEESTVAAALTSLKELYRNGQGKMSDFHHIIRMFMTEIVPRESFDAVDPTMMEGIAAAAEENFPPVPEAPNFDPTKEYIIKSLSDELLGELCS